MNDVKYKLSSTGPGLAFKLKGIVGAPTAYLHSLSYSLRSSNNLTSAMEDIEEKPPNRRRFTTLEGWREVGQGVYLAAGLTVSSVAYGANQHPRYYPEWGRFDDSESSRTRISKYEEQRRTFSLASRSFRTNSSQSFANPFISPEEAEAERSNGGADAGSGTLGGVLEADQPRSQQPFHIFSKKQKWVVVVIIGIAGLFSGLSSNIYFPSLDAIARVQCPPPYPNITSRHVALYN